jgi:hypothetical protein
MSCQFSHPSNDLQVENLARQIREEGYLRNYSDDRIARERHAVINMIDYYKQYGQNITLKDILQQGEKKLIAWVYQYYLLRRSKIVRQQEPICYKGFCFDFTPASILERVWIKVKR